MEITAKEDFKVKEAFVALVRKILVKNPKAGSDQGTGSVFGAGRTDNSGDGHEVSPAKKTDKKSTEDKKDKKSKKMCMLL